MWPVVTGCDKVWPIVTRYYQCDQLWPGVTNSNIYHLLLKPSKIKNQLRRRSTMWVYHLVLKKKFFRENFFYGRVCQNPRFSLFLALVHWQRGRLLGPLEADPTEILRGKRARDDANFVGAHRGTRAQVLKNHKKLMVLALFGPGWPTVRPIARPPISRSDLYRKQFPSSVAIP